MLEEVLDDRTPVAVVGVADTFGFLRRVIDEVEQFVLLTVGGSLLMERFFSVPGMGPLLTDAIQRYDLNVVQTLVILYAALGIVGVFLGDVLMMLVDPRITLTGKEAAR